MARNPAWNRSALLLLLAVAVCFQTWSDLWPYWANKNATYTHGTLIALSAIFLVWRARAALAGLTPAPALAVLPVVLLLAVAWTIAARGNVLVVHAMLWPLLAFALLWTGVGWRVASHFAFPLGFLYFAIPVWEYLKPPLQAISAFVVGAITTAAGMPVLVDGPYLTLPDVTILIALDCSGAHFLSVALAVGALAIWFRGDGPRTGVLILVMAALFSMVFNWLRLILIVLAYLHPDLRHSLETMGHLTFGWWVFALDLVAFAFVLRFVPAPDPEQKPVRAQSTWQPPAATPGLVAPALAAAALLIPLSSWIALLIQKYPTGTATPIRLAGLTGPIAPDSRWRPAYDGAAWAHRAAYMEPDGRVVELYRNEYHQQSQGYELISRGTSLFDPKSFRTRSSAVVTLKSADTPLLDAMRIELQDRSGRPWTALYTYLVGDDAVPSESRAQLLTALHSLYGRPAAGVLAVMMPCSPDCTSTTDDLDAVMITAYEAYRRATTASHD